MILSLGLFNMSGSLMNWNTTGGLDDGRKLGDIIQYNWRPRKFSLVDVMVTNHHKAHNLDNFLEVGRNGGAKLMETWKETSRKTWISTRTHFYI